MRPSARAWWPFLLLYGALLAWQADRWLFTAHGNVSTWTSSPDGIALSAGTPQGIVQSFSMGADGLDGVWLRLGAPRPTQGELVVDLAERRAGGRFRLERVVLPAADLAGRRAVHVPFRPIRASRGRSYALSIRHLRFGEGPAVDVVARRQDALPGERLIAGGVERWGDLVLETTARRATLPYWLHEVLRPWPSWVRAWPTVAAVLVLFNALLAWACAQAVGLTGRVADVVTAPATPASAADRLRRSTRLIVGAVVLIGVGMALWPTPAHRTVDLIAHLPDASFRVPGDSLHGAVAARVTTFDGRRSWTIHALPPGTIKWTVDVPADAVLRVGAAMRPDLWTAPSDGIQMKVHVTAGTHTTTLAAVTLFPFGVPAHRRIVPLEMPLQPWAGQRIQLTFETTPEGAGNAVNDVPVWLTPRLDWPWRRGGTDAPVVTADDAGLRLAP